MLCFGIKLGQKFKMSILLFEGIKFDVRIYGRIFISLLSVTMSKTKKNLTGCRKKFWYLEKKCYLLQ